MEGREEGKERGGRMGGIKRGEKDEKFVAERKAECRKKRKKRGDRGECWNEEVHTLELKWKQVNETRKKQ